MAGFVLYMVSANSIRYGTITGYVWAVVDKHISMGYASPLSNVRDWAPFMHGVEVEIHVPTEPRLMLPWLLFIRAIPKADLSKPHEVAWVLVMLFLFFLISRPELLPTAQGAFEAGKHLARKDVRWVKGYLEVCLEGIKQDPLCKRKACVQGKSWRAIGNGSGILNTLGLLQHYIRQVTYPSDDSPLFLDERGNPLTYAAANRGLRVLLRRVAGVTADVADRYALGGIRVLARNAVAGVAGDETARIQGMWEVCDTYYDRPMLERVLSLPSKMAEYAASAAMPAGGVLECMGSAASFLQTVSPPDVPAITTRTPARPVSPTPIVRAPRSPRTFAAVKPRGWSDAEFSYLVDFASGFGGRPVQWTRWAGTRSRKAAQHAWSRYHPAAAAPPSPEGETAAVPTPPVPTVEVPFVFPDIYTVVERRVAVTPAPRSPLYLHEIVVESERPSSRPPPRKRARI